MSDLEAQRAARRAAMPTVAAIVDEMRAQFPGLRVTYAQENGVTAGKRDENENAFTLPSSYLRPFAQVTKEGGK